MKDRKERDEKKKGGEDGRNCSLLEAALCVARRVANRGVLDGTTTSYTRQHLPGLPTTSFTNHANAIFQGGYVHNEVSISVSVSND